MCTKSVVPLLRAFACASVLAGASLATAAAPAVAAPTNICAVDKLHDAAAALSQLDPDVAERKAALRARYLPMDRPAELLLYRPFVDVPPAASAPAADSNAGRLRYRVVLLDMGADGARPLDLLTGNDISSAAATTGSQGTDFRHKETTEAKTLLVFTPSARNAQAQQDDSLWPHTRLVVIGCSGPGAGTPVLKAVLDTQRSSIGWSRAIAIVCCIVCYLFAATGTFYVHRSQQVDPSRVDPQQPKSGTNYANWWHHLNPVVLTAGSNGLGSATKLQVMFFSVLVFGVLVYIWLLSGHLTDMSTTVLLLMGISGFGATAAAGTELARNRLEFKNWSWLVNRRWLPQGGVAEANMAKWKDIVTTGGEFDATRFQMITFSLLVGGALLTAGSDLMDLSSFEIPTALLGILGLSQVVYVGGKLTSAPAVSDLNDQINTLRKAEADLSVALSQVNSGLFDQATVPLVDDPSVQAASAAYCSYLDDWQTAQTSFEATLGRLVPEWAQAMRPPFDVPDIVKPTPNALPAATRGTAYAVQLSSAGGTAPYVWTLVRGALPAGLALTPAGHIGGVPSSAGKARFMLKVSDQAGLCNMRDFVIQTS